MNPAKYWPDKILATAICIALPTAAISAQVTEVTIDGKVSEGSSGGTVYDGKHDYLFDGTTRNLNILSKGCPANRNGDTPCKVRFTAQGIQIIAIVSATPPTFGGIAINRPGSVFDAGVCDQASAVGFGVAPGCQHFDNLSVQVLTMNQSVAQIRWNGQLRYVLSQRVNINCHGTEISIASYLGKNFPPGMKSC